MRISDLLQPPGPAREVAYRRAFVDWLACAVAGRREVPLPPMSPSLLEPEDVVRLGAAGHYLDFDDTYLPGMLHVSAVPAPVAVVSAIEVDASMGDLLDAFAHGFEAAAALGRATNPGMYAAGWHTTTACGVVGGAVAAAYLAGGEHIETAGLLSLTGAGGLQAAFGNDAKAIQVGLAAAAALHAARAAATVEVPETVLTGANGFLELYAGGGTPRPVDAAIDDNWLKAYPCCLQTHTSVEAALQLRAKEVRIDASAPVELRVSPMARRAAHVVQATTGLEAKFSLPYVFSLAYLHGAPRRHHFDGIDPEIDDFSGAIQVVVDERLTEPMIEVRPVAGARFTPLTITAALGSPQRPMDADQHRQKVVDLCGWNLDEFFEDPGRPARDLREVLTS